MTKRPTARVNGQMVARAPRSRPDQTRWNEDIAWLLNESRGELGERGMSIDPSGGGGRNPENTLPLYERLDGAVWAVGRWRRLNNVLVALDAEHQRTLRSRYRDQERQHSEIMGLRAAFADLATLAWDMADDREALRKLLSTASGQKNPVIDRLRRKSELANKRAHVAWLDEMNAQALDTECPPRST